MPTMRALIVGAGGQLGRALLEVAPSEADVVALRREELDVTDADAVESAVARARPDIVFNAAGYTAVDQAEAEPEAAFRINRDAVGNLASAADRAGARLVHVSTDFVFDGRSTRPYRPDDPTAPLGVYGSSKLAGEAAALAAVDALIVRTAWVYAANGRNFVRTMLRLFGERPAVSVVDDQLGTPTSAASLARALWSLAAQRVKGVFHYTDAGTASWYDLAVAVCEEGSALGLFSGDTRIDPVRTEDFPTVARRPAYGVLDKTATWTLLNRPARHWRQELRDVLLQIRDQDLG